MQSDFQNLKTLTNELREQRNKLKLDFLLSIPAFSQLDRSVIKAGGSLLLSFDANWSFVALFIVLSAYVSASYI